MPAAKLSREEREQLRSELASAMKAAPAEGRSRIWKKFAAKYHLSPRTIRYYADHLGPGTRPKISKKVETRTTGVRPDEIVRRLLAKAKALRREAKQLARDRERRAREYERIAARLAALER